MNAGDISNRPDIVIKDNAFIGEFFPGTNPVHTDIITEFSGNTKIPGKISVRCFAADTKNNTFIKDSFIGITMDVVCGPATNTKNFPMEQGRYNQDAPKGTLFTSATMKVAAENFVRNTATLRLGKNTYVYTPTGFNARIYWAYVDPTGQLAYAGESLAVSQALTKLDHPVYRVCMVAFARNPTLTPAELGESGAKILGHISGSLLQDFRPESASGQYMMDKSSFLMNTDNFGLNTTQLRFLAGSMYDTTMYTKTDRQDYKPYGTFRNVERLEYTKYLADSHRTAATRDTYISAYDCPLLRVDDYTYNTSLTSTGDLTLRRCIVPKAEFQNDVINGNTYEDIDFSYANEDLGFTMAGYTRFISSHKQGIYRMIGGPTSTGFASHKGNLADTARLYQAEVYLPLDGDLVESGSYSDLPGTDYEDAKIAASNRVRMARPLATFGAIFPSMPTGYAVNAIIYLDSSFIITSVVSNPTSISTDDPYFILVFRKGDGNTPLPVNEFIALNITLRIIDHTKVPEITGSAYVGAGCTVRGDVKLIGDPYVNRLLDVNAWEWGSINEGLLLNGWEAAKNPSGGPTDVDRRRFKEVIPVEPGAKISCNSGYWFNCYVYAFDGTYLGTSNWSRSWTVTPDRAAFIGIILKKSEAVGGTSYIEDSDISLANVKYVRAFKKRRYITNELDRNSSEDILIGPDYWEQGTAGGGQADAGKTYEELKATSGTTIRLKRPINVSPSSSISSASGFSRYIRVLDAVTKFHLGEPLNSAKMALLAVIIQKDPSAAITPSEIPNSRLVLEFVPQPRIIVPYGSATLFISGPKIRMYDNAVLSRNLKQEGEIVLSGDAVMGYDFNSGSCMCSNGHSDAIIKLP
ncbi:hypothetical protein NXW15_23715 [Bacteroides thetaiotaomicron]|uniref:hypothetical protein n=1 Tax=Bacteroides thetaiotaomicron TaxID=818 RepID=UPI0021663F0A|nr:hypothetical protein [Bacteroides thetaiotaomicron]MCS3310360.1 hypothetical protein [Bacteroides thetaiotaomicron]